MARPRQVTDEQVLEVARAVFLEQGVQVPVSVIAGRLGVSDAAIFKRFGTKDDLIFAALLPPEQPVFLALLAAGPGPGDLRAQLVRLAEAIAATLQSMIPAMSVLRSSGLDHRQAFTRYDVPPPVRAQQAIAAWLRVAQEQGRLSSHFDPGPTAMVIMGALHFRFFLCHVVLDSEANPAGLDGVPDVPTYARSVIDSLWVGIAPEGSAS